MELQDFDSAMRPAIESDGNTEISCDFAVSCDPTEVVEFPKSTLALKPPPQPPPPIPPPISQLPTRDQRLFGIEPATSSNSAPPTPSRGKVVLSKKERKELGKLNKLLHISNSPNFSAKNNNVGNTGSLSASSSPYKGRVTELKNCIAKMNTRGIFASLNRGSQKSSSATKKQSFDSIPPFPDSYEADSCPPFPTEELLSNNNDAIYAEKLKNLPVRKKVHSSHLENYCLFDPIVSFINEKEFQNSLIHSVGLKTNLHFHGLRDPLFSSSKNLNFEEEELVPEIIYTEQTAIENRESEFKMQADEACGSNEVLKCSENNFDHHNYFVIDPEDFENETALASNNSHLVNSKLKEALSASFDKLTDVCEQNSSLSNSQESKKTTMSNTSTTTASTSIALLESSSSASSNSSTCSETTLQTTLQRTKKKLTFLKLSPFRSHHLKATEISENPEKCSNALQILSKGNKPTERAISEIISSNHIMHLQQMLLSKQDSIRSRTVPIESNYALFNPGPVPSRNIQYKIRKPRPLSTHSDADSGFLSPCSPDEFALKFNPTILVLQQCDSVQGYIEIYTDWANYYLERAKSKKKVTDLSIDCRDGLLLADVIEAVTSFKVPDLTKKPKNQQQMYENVNSCLNFLRSQNVIGLDSITTSDICAGRLKAVLALFFALSRHKQQQQQRKSENGNGNDMSNRQIPSAFTKTNGGTSIPLPSTVMVQRRCNDKVRPLPATPNSSQSIPNLGKSNDIHSNFTNNPPTNNLAIHSNKVGNNNSLRPPNSKTQIPPPTIATAVSPSPMAQKHSMLDKLKIFNKEKQTAASNTPSKVGSKNPAHSKRTSSSSGFSSARSERSDSSVSLNDPMAMSQLKPQTTGFLSASKTRDNKISTKQSKLLAAQMKKEQAKAPKPDKKENSPARSIHKENTSENNENKNSMTVRSKNSFSRLNEKNTNKTSSKSSLNSKSESKCSLVLPTSKTLNSPNGSGLPKPIAAIKGTSKLPDLPSSAGQTIYMNSNHDLIKIEKNDISTIETTNVSTDRKAANLCYLGNSTEQHITNSILREDVSKSSLYANTSNISGENSPMQKYMLKNENATCHQHEFSYTSKSNPLGSPKSSGLATPTRKLQCNASTNSTPPVNHQIPHTYTSLSQPVTPVSTPSKFHTMSTRLSGVGTIFEEEKAINVLPMRPLLHGYNSHVTLPSRAKGRYNNNFGDYLENDNVQAGYCSDGDSLRVRNSRLVQRSTLLNARTSSNNYDVDHDGYLSEGSGGASQKSCSQSGSSHGKNLLSMMRTQLPTTIEERMRSSRGSLDSIGSAPISSIASQTSSRGGPNNKMEGNLSTVQNSSNNNAFASPEHHIQPQQMSENWTNGTDQLNGHMHEKSDKSSSSTSRRHVTGNSSGGSPKQGSSSSRTKVPTSFGYVKRANGTAIAEQQNLVVCMSGHSITSDTGSKNIIQRGRTAHVSAVPRSSTSGRKISGGTQTLPSEHMTRVPPPTQHRSFSLTGPGASQLSKSIRERMAAGSHNLPKLGTETQMFQNRIANRPGKMIDGSLSDTQTYAEVKPEYSTYAMWLKHSSTAGSRLSEGDSIENVKMGAVTRHCHKMMQHRNATIAIGNTHNDSTESPYARLNRSNSIRSTKSEKMYPSMLSRGSDVEMEPYYCLPVGAIGAQNSMLSAQIAAVGAAAVMQDGQSGTKNTSAAWSEPTSPMPLNRGFGGVLSPSTHNNAVTITGLTSTQPGGRLIYPKKNDDVHGSAASLLSGGSSLYGPFGGVKQEERQGNEIRRLKTELIDAREQVLSLSSQLSTNAHVVAAFEQSLSNMTSRLQQLTATAERKDDELTDMRQTIELLRKQSIQAGLTTAHMQSMGVQTQAQTELLNNNKAQQLPASTRITTQYHNGTCNTIQRHHSTDSMCSVNSASSACSVQDKKQKKKGWLRSSFTKAFSRNAKISKTSRHSGRQQHIQQPSVQHSSPLRGSKHILEKSAIDSNVHGSYAEPAIRLAALSSQPQISMQNSNSAVINGSPSKGSPAKTVTLIENAKPIDAIDHDGQFIVEDLKKQLREKDLVLTDIRLEALSSASQLENLKETVNKMRAEMMTLKQNNERLQKLVTSRSLAGSETSLGNAISPNGAIGESRRYSLADGNVVRPPMELPNRLEEEIEDENIPPGPAPEPPPLSPAQTHIDLAPPPPALETIPSPTHLSSAAEELPDITDGKKISIACYLGQPESYTKYFEEMLEADEIYAKNACGSNVGNVTSEDTDRPKSFCTPSPNEYVIAYTYISGKTTWQNLDYIVRKTFKDYLSTIDPGTNLGLNTDSITSYHLGEAKRGPEMGFPELLPCGYIIGNVRTLYICLQGVGSLAFDSLIPRSIVHRYISLMSEHRRLILCGPSGTGKSYLARRLAEFLVARSGRGNPSEAIATFNVDHKSSKELRQYLGHIAEQASIANGASELPSVIILDNLHHASALGDVFSCLLSSGPAAKLPCIIGTMSQATCNTTNLQLHHNFRWVLTANHMEPVRGFLGRFLRRRLFQLELQIQQSQPELAAVLAWLPLVWQHINRFLETHSSSDVTIGPRLFLSCPLDLKDSQVWFTDIWNYHLSPYLVEAVREGVQLYGRRGGVWNDPSAFIRNSYPWPYGPDSVPPLRQINAEDVGLEGMPANASNENTDPLLNMLMRLQEAANYSENQDEESECASLDSNITADSSAGAE